MVSTHIHIRPATETDQQTIRQMVRDAHLDPMGLHWSHFFVAEEENHIVGIGQIRPASPELGSLVVLPSHQKRGIGGQLVRELLNHWQGSWPVYLECLNDMVPYYEKLGFSTIQWHKAPFPLVAKSGLGTLLGVRVSVMYIQSKASIL